MRRQIIVVFFSLFWLAAVPACATERGALFKVTGNGHSMYLFGTMHVGLPEFYPLEPRITQAIAGASTLALEVDPALPPEVVAKAMHDYGMAGAGPAMPAPLARRLARALANAELDPALAASFKPWLVAMLLSLHEVSVQGYLPELAVDAHLAGLARAGKVEVMALESLDGQLALFNGLTDADQWRYLDESITMVESGKQGAEVRRVLDAWRTADRPALDALAEKVANDSSFFGRFTQRVLLDGRNRAMADKLLDLLARENNTVAAIGVLHLLGKHSVPVLMRARGVTVERVY